jgi:hypothetical protein
MTADRRPDPVAPAIDLEELRRLAALCVEFGGDPPELWRFDPLAEPNSVYARYIAAANPVTILALLDRLAALEGQF